MEPMTKLSITFDVAVEDSALPKVLQILKDYNFREMFAKVDMTFKSSDNKTTLQGLTFLGVKVGTENDTYKYPKSPEHNGLMEDIWEKQAVKISHELDNKAIRDLLSNLENEKASTTEGNEVAESKAIDFKGVSMADLERVRNKNDLFGFPLNVVDNASGKVRHIEKLIPPVPHNVVHPSNKLLLIHLRKKKLQEQKSQLLNQSEYTSLDRFNNDDHLLKLINEDLRDLDRLEKTPDFPPDPFAFVMLSTTIFRRNELIGMLEKGYNDDLATYNLEKELFSVNLWISQFKRFDTITPEMGLMELGHHIPTDFYKDEPKAHLPERDLRPLGGFGLGALKNIPEFLKNAPEHPESKTIDNLFKQDEQQGKNLNDPHVFKFPDNE